MSVHTLLLNLVTALAYAGSGWLSLQAAIPPDYIAIVFMASGLGLGAVLTGGYRLLPGVALGSLGVQGLAHWQSGLASWGWSMAVTPLGAAAMAGATAWAVRRWIGYPSALDHPRQAVLTFFAVIPAFSALNASVSVPALTLDGVIPPSDALFAWWTWWLADTLGAVIFTPLMLVAFGAPAQAWRPRWRTVALPMTVALALVVGLLQFLNLNLQRDLDDQFARSADDLAQRLQRRFDAQIDSVEAIGKLMELTSRVDQPTFESAARLWLQRYPGTQNFGWSPYLLHEQRARYEQSDPGWPVLAAMPAAAPPRRPSRRATCPSRVSCHWATTGPCWAWT